MISSSKAGVWVTVEPPWADGRGMDRRSRVPYYVQLKDLLQEQIESDVWQPGDRLPSEAELCQRFGVSRTVVRQALAELVHESLVVREQGKGSFVAVPKISEALVQRLTGFYEDMAERGLHPVSKVLRQEVVPASATLARHLDIEAGSALIVIDRLRFIKDAPLVLVTTCIPRDMCPQLLSIDLRYRSLYDVLGQEAGLVITRGRRWIEAVAASARQASLLEVKRGAPLIRLESVSFLADGRPVEYYDAIHRSDRARFEVDLVRLDPGWPGRKEGEPTEEGRSRAASAPGRASRGLVPTSRQRGGSTRRSGSIDTKVWK
ncbi:MAG TPA: GntR family transcriptional regulator [Candidatus Limnocylindrales bacterium]|nr:GntR family transcriptional regulator [Candidatus Limnocylindrales bacterium]